MNYRRAWLAGSNVLNKLRVFMPSGDICRQQHIHRPLIVTDPGIVQLGMLSQLETALSNADLPFASFTQVVADPPEAIILDALDQARAEGVDGIIGFGGGSSMDTAKLVALMARSGETLQDIYGVEQTKGQRLLINNPRPVTEADALVIYRAAY